MSGFQTSRPNSIVAMAKQHGSVLRGYGPPVPQAGVTGDLYADVLTFQLFEKREINGLDPWGHYLFVIPALYRNTLKWFGASAPSNTIGIIGDYFMQWAGYDDYGMMPKIWGPKQWTGWPENGDGPDVIITNPGVYPLGLLDEGPVRVDKMPNQLIAVGLLSEYIIPLVVTANPGEPVSQTGVQSSGQLVLVALNALYTAADEHAL